MPTIMRNGKPTYISVDEYNRELAEYRVNVLGIDESTGKLKHYKVDDLGKIWINGQEFTGMAYQGLLTVNTKTYVEEPKRANDGSIPNINDYDTFVVPRCKVNFKYFNIQDYRRLCDAVQSNEFYVKYYDKQHNEFVQHKMYCEPEEMSKLYNVGTDVFGVLDYEVSFIGTLNDLETFKVTYEPFSGELAGSLTIVPQPYNSTATYTRGDVVYLQDGSDESTRRYFVAIFYQDTFKEQPLTNTTYWEEKQFSLYNSSTKYNVGSIVYEQLKDGRNYYLVVKNTPSVHSLTDTYYFQKIAVKQFSLDTTYSKGQYVINVTTENGVSVERIYEAIYYNESFSGAYPTETSYWSQMALGTGVEVKWGNSIVIANPLDLFTLEGYSANSWNTNPDGKSGFSYVAGQSLNVFNNLTLYPEWKKAKV